MGDLTLTSSVQINENINAVGNAVRDLKLDTTGYTTKNNKTLEYADALLDIAQAHYFTMQVSQIPITVNHPKFGAFLPVKSANFSYTSFEHMSIPVGIYGNISLMRRKSVGRLGLTLYDNDQDQVEKGIRNWINNCFPKGGMYVNYLSEIYGELRYTSYSVKGIANDTLKYMVIPADNFQVNRDYESGGAKMINFGLIIVGSGERMEAQADMTKTDDYNKEIPVEKKKIEKVQEVKPTAVINVKATDSNVINPTGYIEVTPKKIIQYE